MHRNDRWVFLFFLGLLFFNWPFLTAFESHLPVVLFLLWGLCIALAALFAFLSGRDRSG